MNLSMIVGVLWSLIAVVLYALYKQYTKAHPPPGLPPKVSGGLPFLGNIESAINPTKFFASARAKYGDVYRFEVVGLEWFVLTGRSHFGQYFKAREDVLSFEETMNHVQSNRMIHGVEGDYGRALNSHMIFAIKKALAVRMEEDIWRVALMDIERLPLTGSVDLMDFSQKMIGHVISVTFFGIESLPNELFENLQQFSTLIDQGIRMFMLCKPLVWYYLIPKLDKIRKRIHAQLIPFAAEARQNLEAGVSVTAYVQSLLEKKIMVEDQERLTTDAEVASCMAQVYFAAVANTGRALANTLVMLLDHPEKSLQLSQELETLSVPSINENKLLQSWIDETARVSKGVLGSVRFVNNDEYHLAGYDIPRGSRFLVDSFSESIENNEMTDRDKFRPERWLESAKVDKNLNWGSGLHLCPGRNFAYAELRLCVARILRNIQLKKSEKPAAFAPSMSDPFQIFPKSYLTSYSKI